MDGLLSNECARFQDRQPGHLLVRLAREPQGVHEQTELGRVRGQAGAEASIQHETVQDEKTPPRIRE